MKRVANTYSVNSHFGAQRVTARALPAPPRVPSLPRELLGAMTDAHRWAVLIPSWVVLAMILLATVAVCATVIMRTRSELQVSSAQHQRVSVEIDELKRTNAALRAEVGRLQNDPITIESAARARLNMVRPNEIVVALEARNPVSKVEPQSFVR